MSKENQLLTCPQCGSAQVAVTEETKFMVNTGDYYCRSVKAHDPDAKTTCLTCGWEGRRDQLTAQAERERGE